VTSWVVGGIEENSIGGLSTLQEVIINSTHPLDIVIHGGLFIFLTFAMKTKVEGNEPHKRA
jgi:hypothetical protein